MGLPLAGFFHARSEEGGATHHRIQEFFPEFDYSSKETGKYDHVVSKSYEEWRSGKNQREEGFTSRIKDNLEKALPTEDVKLRVTSEGKVPDPLTQGYGRYDVMLASSANHSESTVLLVEAGLNNDEWWRKFEQGRQYLQNLKSFAGPALLAVVTLTPPGIEGATPVQKKAKNSGGGVDFARLGVFLVTKEKKGQMTTGAIYRISLLWHKRAEDIKDASDAFGRIVDAACLLPEWIEKSNEMKSDGMYTYLGPSCCKIGRERNGKVRLCFSRGASDSRQKGTSEKALYSSRSSPAFPPSFSLNDSTVPTFACWLAKKKEGVVLRAYDNRVVYTERRPDVYLDSEELTGPTVIVCDFHYDIGIGTSSSASAPMTAKDFGCIPEGSDRSDWLWADRRGARCSCRLLVISTPYYPGRHWARSVEEFMPLIDQLEQFHKRDFVHGDIRATNTAFCISRNNEKSRLFDWDMGGKVIDGKVADGKVIDSKVGGGEVSSGKESDGTVLKYPKGFRHLVFDGIRAGRDGEPITKIHDWVALTGLILKCHCIIPPSKVSAELSTEARLDLYERRNDLQGRKQDLLQFPDGDTVVGDHVVALRSFLSEVATEDAKWEVKLDKQFHGDLVRHGYFHEAEDNQEPPAGSADATGSPSKK